MNTKNCIRYLHKLKSNWLRIVDALKANNKNFFKLINNISNKNRKLKNY